MKKEQPKSDVLLLVIAIYKLTTAGLFFIAALGVLHLLNKDVEAWVRTLIDNLHVDPDNRFAHWLLQQAEKLTNAKLEGIGLIAFFYSALFATEGLGLYFRKHWAEYLVVIVTGSLLPVECYELWHSINWIKVLVFVGNLIILGYLIQVIRSNNRSSET